MSLDLYEIKGSPPCLAVQLLSKEIGVDLNVKPIDFSKGEHLTPEFVKVSLAWNFSFF